MHVFLSLSAFRIHIGFNLKATVLIMPFVILQVSDWISVHLDQKVSKWDYVIEHCLPGSKWHGHCCSEIWAAMMLPPQETFQRFFSEKEERKWRQHHEWCPASTGCLRNRPYGSVWEHLMSGSLGGTWGSFSLKVVVGGYRLFLSHPCIYLLVDSPHFYLCANKYPQLDSLVHPAAVWWNYFFVWPWCPLWS